jgi:endonuclease/exonuclease/phosphatase family metal-dependent hydrolase
MGDFNTPPRSRAYRHIAETMQDAQRAPGIRRRERTFPTRFPTLRLDHVFVRGPIEVLSATTVRTPLARLASDHLPLITELCISKPERHPLAAGARHHAEMTMRPSDV